MASLYLHIPFCRRKCPYCDFFSTENRNGELADYVELLVKHLQILQQKKPRTTNLETIFFGGGTPSLLEPAQMEQILSQVRQSFGIVPTAEISLEANPGTLNGKKLAGYRKAGVNRLSLGVQSLVDSNLDFLGRIHRAEKAREAVKAVRQAGFDNLSLDLMINLPGQTGASLDEEISAILLLSPDHLSLYGLTVEPHTPLATSLENQEFTPVTDEEAAAQYRLVHERLLQAGFEHYEISNFARPGYRCQHNQVYWQRRSCLAAGCGGHSFDASDFGSRRHVPPNLESFRQNLTAERDPAEELERFNRSTAMAETIYLALRTTDGLSRQDFIRRFGVAPEEQFPQAFRKLENRLHLRNGHWSFDLDGWLLYDHLISEFL